MRCIQTLILAVSLAVTLPSIARAEAGRGGSDRAQAEQRFRRGVEFINQERWEEGLEAFDESYRLYPTQAALFNRAMCLRLLRRYGEAMDALVEYRSRYASQVSAERMAEVDAELRTLESLIGQMTVTLAGADAADIIVDGQRAGTAPTERPVVMAPGRHTVELRAEGFRPFSQTVTVSSGESTTLRATLSPLVSDAAVVLNVNVPGATVSLGGAQVGTTPLAGPVPVASGTATFAITRPGYARSEVNVRVEPGETATADVVLRPLSPLPPQLAGQLDLDLTPSDAEVLVDGQPWTEGPVPVGPHRLQVRRAGMQTWSQDVEVAAGQPTALAVALVPERSGGRQHIRSLIIAGFVSLGVGVAIAASGGGIYGWNAGRWNDWEDEGRRLRLLWDAFYSGTGDYNEAELLRLSAANADLRESARTMDAVGFALIGVGAAAIAASIPLLVLGYRGRPAATAPTVSVVPTPGGLALGASFAF
jgi:hypothetical protein